MSFYITDTLFLDFYLNEINLPFQKGNIDTLLITQNIYDNLPALRLTITDDTNALLSNYVFSDGVIFTIMLGTSPDDAVNNTANFAIVGVPIEQLGTSESKYSIYGILNNLKYLKKTTHFDFEGTSSEALKYIADKCLMKSNLTYTSDSMVWHSNNHSYSKIVKEITSHSYVNNTSCMVSYVDLHSTLNLININELQCKILLTNIYIDDSFRNKNPLFNDYDEIYKYSEITFKSDVALFNLTRGYKNSISQYSLFKNDDFYLDEIKVNNYYADYYNINYNSYNDVGDIYHHIMPLDVGNVHKNYARAEYQNVRYKSTFSVCAEVYFNAVTNIKVGSKVELLYMNSNIDVVTTPKARFWFVESKSFGISGGNYIEKIVISTNGYRLNPFNNLVR